MTTVPTLTFDMYTIRDIAESLGVNVATVHQWRHRGQLPKADGQIGRTLVWLAPTIELWIAAKRTRQPDRVEP